MKNEINWVGRFDDHWWLEYIEGEHDQVMAKNLENLIDRSPKERQKVDQLERIKRLVKESDNVCLPEDVGYYDSLHEKIMGSIENSSERRVENDPLMNQSKTSWTALVWSAIARRWGNSPGAYRGW